MLDTLKALFKSSAPEATTAPTPPKPQMTEIGIADTLLYNVGKDFTKYNPDSLIRAKGVQVYRNMALDDQVKAVSEFKKHAVISRGFYFDVPPDDNGEPDAIQAEIALFFDHVINSIRGTFTDNLLSILSALNNGFSITEKIYGVIEFEDKPYWGIKDLKLRPYNSFQDGFLVDPHGNIIGLKQRQGAQAIEIPINKVIHYVHQKDIDAQYGESDLRAAYRAWWSKDIAIKFQNIHLERHASGFIHAKVDGSLTPQQETDLQNLIKNISARMGAVLPASVDLKAFQPMRTDAYDRAIAQHDKSIAKSILVPNMLGLSDQGSHGSRALGDTQLTAFFWVLNAIANRLAETLNDQMFRELAQWNFGTNSFPPFTFEPISEEQKAAIAEAWGNLIQKGAVSKTSSDEAWIRQQIGAPEKAEDEEELPPVTPPDMPGVEPVEIPDNDDWINEQPEEKQNAILKEFQEKKWLKRVNFSKLEKTFDRRDKDFADEMNVAMAQIAVSFDKQVSKLFGTRSGAHIKPTELGAIVIQAGHKKALRIAIRDNLNAILDDAYAMAQSELPKKKFDARILGMDKTQIDKFLSSRAMRESTYMTDDLLKALTRVLENSIQYDKTLRDTMGAMQVDTDLVSMLPTTNAAGAAVNIPARLENIARTNNAIAVNQARQSLFGSPELKGFVVAYEYSAILDDRVSDICSHLNGKVRRDFGVYTPPNHFQCRSILVPVTMVDGWDGKESTAPRLQPQKGFA